MNSPASHDPAAHDAGDPTGTSAATGPPPAPRTTSSETRDRLIDAAMEVFLEKGYEGVRVQHIARRAGYTTGALYAHFENRNQVLAAAIEHYGDLLLRSIAQRISDVEPGDGAAVQAIAQAITSPPRPWDRLLMEIFAAYARNESTREALQPALDAVVRKIKSRLGTATELGLISPDLDDEAVLTFFVSLILGGVVVRTIGVNQAEATPLADLLSLVQTTLARPPEAS